MTGSRVPAPQTQAGPPPSAAVPSLRQPRRQAHASALNAAALARPVGVDLRGEASVESDWLLLSWGEPVVRCPTEAIARHRTSTPRGSTCASSGPCSRPAARVATAECVSWNSTSRPCEAHHGSLPESGPGGTTSSTRRACCSSSLSRRGLSTDSATSGRTPPLWTGVCSTTNVPPGSWTLSLTNDPPAPSGSQYKSIPPMRAAYAVAAARTAAGGPGGHSANPPSRNKR
jgi:hypothetical protein